MAEALSRLTEQVTSKAEVTRDKGRRMLEHRKEYVKLKTRLETLSDDMEHSVMVPMTSKAFMPGKLVHTNEIMVLLGDNWFVQTSAKRASEIAGRRIKACDDILESLEKELELVEGWRKQAKMFGDEKSETVEISEDFDEEAEKEWDKRHAENVKKQRQTESNNDNPDKELWERLEELEVQEALEKEWDNEEEEEEEVSDIDEEEESECTTDNIVTSDDDDDEMEEPVKVPKVQRRVSWVGAISTSEDSSTATALDPLKTISFAHSEVSDTPDQLGAHDDPCNPSDLVHFACRQPKSILKPTESEILVKEGALDQEPERTFDSKKVISIDPEHNPVQDVIIERNVAAQAVTEPENEVRKVSKFKAARLKAKQ